MSSNILDIKKHWDKPIAVILGIVILLPLYYVSKDFVPSSCSLWWRLLILGCIELLFVVIWLISTNRISMPSSKYTMSLFVHFDDDKAEDEIKRLVSECVKSANSKNKFIRIIRHPYNYITNEDDAKNYYSKSLCRADIVLMLKVRSGYEMINGNKNYKLEVFEQFFVGKFDTDSQLNFYKTDISIKKDLAIRNSYKNWEYIDSNTFNDRQKISANLKDTLLYSCGIYLLFHGQLDYSLQILKELHKPGGNLLTKQNVQNGRFVISKEQFANARLANILMNLLYIIAFREQVYNNNCTKAYSTLLECERLFPNAPQEVGRYVLLAKCAYECGDLGNSKRFTSIVAKLKGGAFFSYLNYGFYAIIENDISALAYNYSKVCNYTNTADFDILSVVEFLENHKSKVDFKDKVHLLDFASAMITKLFVNDDEGNRLIDDFSTHNMDNQDLQPLLELCSKYRTKVLDRRKLEERKSNVKKSNKKKKRRR